MHRHVTVLVAVALLASCDLSTEPSPRVFDWFGLMEAAEGWNIQGEAAIQWFDDTTEFTTGAVIAMDEPGAVRPWHVHHNTCDEGGGIVGSDADYPRLVVDESGTAGVVTTVPTVLDPEADYHVNVHLSEAEMETVIACADLRLL